MKRTLELCLHEKQQLVASSRARFRVVVAGRRWGKTQLAKTEIIKRCSIPNQLIWYVAPSYRMAKRIMWNEIIKVLPKQWIKRMNETMMNITLINNTEIELKGADKPNSLRGVGLHFLVIDEFQDIKNETWQEVLRPTLAENQAPALFIGTPKGFNHLYKLYSLGQVAENIERRKWQSWQFSTITSPFIPDEEIEAARRDMDEKSFRQEFEASFEQMTGLVYYPYDENVHVGNYPFNPDLPIWICQDFNINPMSTVIAQPQRNGEVWCVDEIVKFSSNTQEVTEDLEKRFWRVLNNTVVYPDPAGSYGQHARGETDLDIFREKGFRRIKYRRKHPNVSDRINAVNRMLRAADGTIRLRIDKRCVKLRESFQQTVYRQDSREIDKVLSVEHSTDALGYMIELEFPVRKIDMVGRSL